uniref:Integron gene cassette protein n=1 Tax=Macrostomum lignano TaxID=282301 RepID=A0A1I8FII2_9PLAT
EAVSSLAGSLASSLSRRAGHVRGSCFRAWSSGASSFRWQRIGPQLESAFPRLSDTAAAACGPFIPARDHQAFDEFLHDRRPVDGPVTMPLGEHREHRQQRAKSGLQRGRSGPGSRLHRCSGASGWTLSQQQFASPATPFRVLPPRGLNCGRSPGPAHKYLARWTGLEEFALHAWRHGGARAKPVKELSPRVTRTDSNWPCR